MNTASTITAIIPVHNGERYLAEAIRSVLDQTLPPDELIVVDDGSTDASAQVARSFGPPVRVLAQANLGPAAARNLGAQQASGDLLAFLDADDLWTPEKLARQSAVLAADPVCDAVLGRVENFVSPELDESQAAKLARTAAQSGEFHIGALLIRRDAFRRVGWFDAGLRHGEFIDWWARATQLHLAYTVLPDLVLRRRLHADNLTRREPGGRSDYLALLRQHLARGRETAGAGMETR
ncbi:MAG: glycosyltransferase family 2 protein [Caldilineales bacterium]|nr:glycosyltransferase family 2 protein [Caldilineales bacterium]